MSVLRGFSPTQLSLSLRKDREPHETIVKVGALRAKDRVALQREMRHAKLLSEIFDQSASFQQRLQSDERVQNRGLIEARV